MANTIEPGWELYRSFLETLRRGSLSGAARTLKLTQPTIGRHVAELESALGTVLFTRSQKGLQPTGAALELAPYAEAMASTAASLVRAASAGSDEVRGAVRIGASEVFGVEVLPPILTALHGQQPKLALELVASNEVTDLLRRDVDIAVRNLRPTQSALVGKKIGDVTLGLYAHRNYLDAHSVPREIDDLSHHALIGYDRETPVVRALQAKGMRLTRDQFAFRCDSDLARIAALRAGFGIGVCQVPLASRDPNLLPVLAKMFSFNLEVWLVMHENLRATRRLRLTFEHLDAELSAYIRGGTRRGAAGARGPARPPRP